MNNKLGLVSILMNSKTETDQTLVLLFYLFVFNKTFLIRTTRNEIAMKTAKRWLGEGLNEKMKIETDVVNFPIVAAFNVVG